MSHRIVIQFAAGSDVHRVRNFGEALRRSLLEIDGMLPIQQIDAVVDRLEVVDVHSRKLKLLLTRAEKLLAEHNISTEISTDH